LEKLIIYKSALDLVKEIYLLLSKNNSLHHDYSLCDQVKRASVSVVLNIAEGYGRGKLQFKNYLRIAVGSTNEVIAALQIINKVHNIQTVNLQNKYIVLAKQISAFSKSFN